MTNINYFIKALKISWLRRVIQNSDECAWYSLSNIDFTHIFSMGSGYAAMIRQTINNPFWKEILCHWSEFCDSVSVESVYQVLDSPIWYNGNLNKDQILY